MAVKINGVRTSFVGKGLPMPISIEKSNSILAVFNFFFLLLNWSTSVVYGTEDQWGEDKLKKTLDDIDELYKEYPWLREAEGI